MPPSIQIRANGAANQQVTDAVKEALSRWLRSVGVSDARADVSESNVLFTHFDGGEYVAVSNHGVDDVEAFNRAYSDAVDSYWRNEASGDDCFWIHRHWIAKELIEVDETEGQTTAKG